MGRPQGNRRVDNTFRPPKDHIHLSFCVAYVGTAFRGLQLQGHAPLHHTVEGAFVQALREAGVVRKLERGRIADPHHYIGRSCRTDRGVHAVRNMISLFIPAERYNSQFQGSTDLIQAAVQAVLPPPMTVLNVTRVMPTFSTKNCCNRRVYNYYIPAYAILNAKIDSWETLLSEYSGENVMAYLNEQAPHSYANLDPSAPSSSSSSVPSKFLSDLAERVAFLNQEVTSQFVGSHRFHNFSTDTDQGGKVQSKAISSLSDESVRMILRCHVAPRVYFLPTTNTGLSNKWLERSLQNHTASSADAEAVSEEVQKEIDFVRSRFAGDGRQVPATIPFVVFQVEGASFLLNMIRKMVGTLIAIARGVRPSMLHDTLSPYQRASNPLAPGPYLSLALSFYQGYDSVVRDMKGKAELYAPLEETWHAKGVDDGAATFFSSGVIPDVVDADLNRAVPLDTVLYLRDYLRRCDPTVKAMDDQEDAHLPLMKEYAPSKPHRCPPLTSEMTVFLRLLRIHNWNIRPVDVPEKSKAALEYANKLARRTQAAESVAEDAAPQPDTVNEFGKRPRDESEAVSAIDMPDRIHYLDDGWIYVRGNLEEEQAARCDVLRARFLALKQNQRTLRAATDDQKRAEATRGNDEVDAEQLLNAVLQEGEQFGDGD